MLSCSDPDLGKLLHAYEINALSDEETERFEIHLLGCEYCFAQLTQFDQAASLLRSDDEVKELVKQAAAEKPDSFLTRFWRYLWPEAPMVFRPALGYLLVLVLIFTTYLGLSRSPDSEIAPPQILVLTPGRSTRADYLSIGSQRPGLIRFRFPDAVVGQSYRVLIESVGGEVVFEDTDFSEFDEYGWGQLVIPRTKMEPGEYLLVITDPQGEAPSNRLEYRFIVR